MASRSRTPIFSFETDTPSRQPRENRRPSRPASARDILNSITTSITRAQSPLSTNSVQEQVDDHDVVTPGNGHGSVKHSAS